MLGLLESIMPQPQKGAQIGWGSPTEEPDGADLRVDGPRPAVRQRRRRGRRRRGRAGHRGGVPAAVRGRVSCDETRFPILSAHAPER